ncbi:hypothetical protein BV898_15521 [Hypsibius exemplaris]|uniref:Chitin-binding type-2 domain-containing protein n=1 Tax=Hypsibius exemplaris TaxID=2072580 RepID=A0A9X6RKF0_HYPEX|nr:hypothetical protein BV898_15521 [Hypsibius exemplaris]
MDNASSSSSSSSASESDQDDDPDALDDSLPFPVQVPKRIIRILPPIKGSISRPVQQVAADNSGSQDQDAGSDGSPAEARVPAVSAYGSSKRVSAASKKSSGMQSQPQYAQQLSAESSEQRAQANSAGGCGGDDSVGGGPVETGVIFPPIVEGGTPPPQVPGVWDALDVLRGRTRIPDEELSALVAAAKPGVDYPDMGCIPDQVSFNCANVKQPGYYADTDFKCKFYRRCDINGVETSYICPQQTLFNQILLTCDYWYNVDCSKSAQFQDYSNSRLYHSDWLFLDTPPEVDVSAVDASQLATVQAANAKRSPGGVGQSSGKRRNGSGGRRGNKAPRQPAAQSKRTRTSAQGVELASAQASSDTIRVLPQVKPVAAAYIGAEQDQDAVDNSPSVPIAPMVTSNGGRRRHASKKSSSSSSSSSNIQEQQPQSQDQRARPSNSGVNGDGGAIGGTAVETGVVYPPIVQGGVAPPQVPGVWDALDVLRGRPRIPDEELSALVAAAKPGVDYPDMGDIPDQISFNCANVKQAGYYADTDFKCKFYRRCDINGVETSYICPHQTLFNQILLTCDYWYNVDCSKSAQFQDYSNSRLYHSDWLFLDTPPDVDVTTVDAGQLAAVQAANAKTSAGRARKSSGKKRQSGNRANAPRQPAQRY